MSTIAYRAAAHALRTRAALAVAFANAADDAMFEAVRLHPAGSPARKALRDGVHATTDTMFAAEAAARRAEEVAAYALSVVGATAAADRLIHPGIMTMAGVGSRLMDAERSLVAAMA